MFAVGIVAMDSPGAPDNNLRGDPVTQQIQQVCPALRPLCTDKVTMSGTLARLTYLCTTTNAVQTVVKTVTVSTTVTATPR